VTRRAATSPAPPGQAAPPTRATGRANEYINQTCTLAEWFANAGPQLGSCGGTRTALGKWATRFSQVRP
jgi:hypothetical protein